MSALIQQLIALLGPLIGQLLKALIESLLNKAAKKVKLSATANETDKARALVTEAIAQTPKLRPGVRLLLKSFLRTLEDAEGKLPKSLTSEQKEELKDVIAVAKKEA